MIVGDAVESDVETMRKSDSLSTNEGSLKSIRCKCGQPPGSGPVDLKRDGRHRILRRWHRSIQSARRIPMHECPSCRGQKNIHCGKCRGTGKRFSGFYVDECKECAGTGKRL